MKEFIEMSRAVAADLADEFRGDPCGELVAWFHVALEREGVVASLYQRQTLESRLDSLSARLARSAMAKVNGIRANEEKHVTALRAMLTAEFGWSLVTLRESWGRLQGIVLNHLAGSNPAVRGLAPILLTLVTRSSGEHAAASAVAELDARGFFDLSRTLEITAVESYQRVVALLTALSRSGTPPYSLSLHLEMLGMLRDERVHRDVFHVLSGACGSDGLGPRRARKSGATELPDRIVTRPISSSADLNTVCRAILTFHYGAAIPAGAPPDETMRTAVAYWRWQMENPLRTSYFVECQRQDVFRYRGNILLLGTAGLEDVVRGRKSIRCHLLDQRLIPWCMADGESLIRRPREAELPGSANSTNTVRGRPAAGRNR